MATSFRTKLEGEPGLIVHSTGFLVADMIADGSAEKTLDLTQHPIEDGSPVSDHAIRKPLTVSLTLVQTQTPVRPTNGFSRQQMQGSAAKQTPDRQTNVVNVRKNAGIQANVAGLVRAGLSALSSAASGPVTIEGLKVGKAAPAPLSITVLAADSPVDRINEFNDELWRIQEAVELVTVNFKGRAYPNMVLTRVSRSDTSGAVGRSTFSCEFQFLAKVSTKQVTLPKVPAQRKKISRGAIKPYSEQFGPPAPPDNRTTAALLADL